MKDMTKIYAYDFFDTIVHRSCHSEEIIFRWSKWVSRICRYDICAEDIYNKRKSLEEMLKKNAEEVKYDTLLRELYHSLSVKITIPENEFINSSFKYEVSEDIKHICVDKSTIQEIKDRFDAGNKIIIISDFYVGKEYIECILNAFGIRYLFDAIFVSSDFNKRKSTGNLYKYIINSLNVKPFEILMTGDNKQSDVDIPEKLGIKTVYRPYSQQPQYDYKKLKRLIKQYSFFDNMRSPLNSYAEECAFFISSLYQNIVKNKISLVLFCAREGQALKKMFDYYAFNVNGDKSIKSEYFYTSRRAVILPSLGEVNKEDFYIISRQYKEIKVGDFLKCLNFSNDEISVVCEATKLTVSQHIDFTQHNTKILEDIKKSKTFCDIYEAKRKLQKENLLGYLSKLGVDSNVQRIALVDVGWKGTIQDALQKIFGNNLTIFGFYVGLKLNEYTCSETKNKIGLVFSDYPKKCKNYNLLVRNNMFWERILTADHGPTSGYGKDQNGEFIPLVNKDDANTALYSYIADFQSNMISACKKIMDLYSHTIWEPCNTYALMIEIVLWRECVIYPQISFIEKKTWEMFNDNFSPTFNVKIDIRKKMEKMKEDAAYGFSKQIFEMTNRINLKILNKVAIGYSKIIYLVKFICLKIS